ncbi:ATP-binding protein [Cryomorphaceae bacterium 1068]|nr:ATP-binding protein [Cryomorphaceae bacterium 1068]
MNKLYSALIFLCVSSLALAQRPTVDSLNNLLSGAQNDTARMNLYYNLGQAYARVNMDSSILSLNQALEYAQELQLKGSEVSISDWLGYVNLSVKDYPNTLTALTKGIEIAEDSSAVKYTSGGVLSERERISRLAVMYHRLGNLYYYIGNTNEQRKYYLKAREMAIQSLDSGTIRFSEAMLADYYLQVEKPDSALIYAQNALYISNKIDSGETWTFALLGRIYLQKGELLKSRSYLQKALVEGEFEVGYQGGIFLTLAELTYTTLDLDSALTYAKKAATIFKNRRLQNEREESYTLISKIYDKMGMPDSALVYLRRSAVLKDSLITEEKKNLMAFQNIGFGQKYKVQELEKEKIETKAEIRTYSLGAGIAVFLIVALLLFRNNQVRRKANAVLGEQKKNVEETLVELKSTQSQLIQAEKMASLGELTAGIAHEIQNPLNFVNNFSEVSNELIDEMKDEMSNGDVDEAKELANDIKQNLEKITHHGKRADAIVKGMLAHSRSGKGEKVLTNLNALAEEYLKLAYHGLRAKDKSFNADFKTDFDPDLPKVNVVPQDIGRVLLNLINNAFQACADRSQRAEHEYKPTVTIKTELTANGQQLIAISDNGPGIPPDIKDKIFQPFFTTKPTGQGTGLGLSLSYDIVKAHGGKLEVESELGKGSTFFITLPT